MSCARTVSAVSMIVYRGRPLATERVAEIARRDAPAVREFRQGTTRGVSCIAVGGGSGDGDGDDDGDAERELARALSAETGVACWVMLDDRARRGGFARYADGERVEPRDDDGVWIDDEDYLSRPMTRLAETLALVAVVPIDRLFERAFPRDVGPPVVKVD